MDIFALDKALKGRRVILASKSPRRRELLGLVFKDFDILPAEGEEVIPQGTAAEKASQLLALQKCREVAAKRPEALVIGCDTTVVVGEELCDILGKPRDRQDAARMLRRLSGTRHRVISGAALSLQGREVSFSEVTWVRFRDLTDEEISDYIATGEPMDKAGAYGIQERGALLVSGIEGDFFNVVGLPVSALAQAAAKLLEELE
ncbi:MAG: septum formation protein Maf [Ruminococcus sp.]|nr:septum formation protein Maf [Ruminococcus sp.]